MRIFSEHLMDLQNIYLGEGKFLHYLKKLSIIRIKIVRKKLQLMNNPKNANIIQHLKQLNI